MYRDFWDAGYRIFGLHGVDKNGNCGCGNPECQAIYKHPVISKWSLVPHWSEEQMDAIEESGQCESGYGVLCKGLLVIDVDARNGGIKSYEKLCQDVPEIMQAGLIVETGSGGGSKHLYFTVDESLSLASKHKDYSGLDFKSSGYVVGPGSMHSSGNRYKIVYGSPHEIEPAPQSLIDLIKQPEYRRTEYQGTIFDFNNDTLQEMLSHIDPDSSYDEWIRVGMALHEATNGDGLELWNAWSKDGKKYKGIEELERHWHSFGKSANPVTIGTLVHYAEEGGYIAPVVFNTEQKQEPKSTTPCDTGDIDLLRPPGITGKLTKWINSQCRYPREHLAVAAALTSLGNIAGLRYTDDKDGVTLNLLTLCVAASATGKEAVLQSVTSIHEAVALQSAVAGNIKSEQEIIRNLVRNQACYYVIDEIGYLLQKIESARKKGGAAYLDGIISSIMAVYSKADGSFLVSGDLKETVTNELKKELSQCNAKVDNNEDQSGYYKRRAEMITDYALPQIELGLQRPFLSLMGMTTPVSFNDFVTVEQATNGFIGRAILVKEPETNPKRKRGFKKPPRKLPDNLMMMLSQIQSPNESDQEAPLRIEYHGEKIQIKTAENAIDLLEDIADWLENFAETHKSKTGLEAIIRRSYEQISKISTILAVADGIRTVDHVRWAFAYICRDMEAKIRLAESNMNEGSESALENRILDAVGEGEPKSVILQRVCRSKKYKRQDTEQTITKMLANNTLEQHGARLYQKKPRQGEP